MSAPLWSPDELVGGDPALDLTNTAGGAGKARDRERLTAYAEAIAWARAAGVLDRADAAVLADRAEASPEDASAALVRLRDFRESLHATLAAVALDDPSARSLAAVRSVVQEAVGRADLVRADGAFAWTVGREGSGLDLIRDRAALAAQRLLTGPDLARVRQCERCSWLFLDRGRGRGRRWCSMAACGNRAKAQRHYHRHRPRPDG